MSQVLKTPPLKQAPKITKLGLNNSNRIYYEIYYPTSHSIRFLFDICCRVNHNGVLYDANSNTTIDATLPVIFSIYKSDGQLLWANEKIVEFTDGNYSVTLGKESTY